jgi:hypothetical protein
MQRAHPSHFPSPGHTEARLACCREGFLQTLREAADEAIHHPDWPEVLGVVAGECFDDAMGQQNRRWGEQVQGLTASRISLVHDQDMDYAVELMNLEQRLRSFCGRELAAVHLRLKEVFEAIGLTLGSELPLGPEVVCRALRALRDREKLNPDEALDLIGQLESSLCNHLCSFYRRLEHQLAALAAPALSPVAVPRVVDPEAWIDGPAARSSLPIDPLASLRLSVLARREATVGGAGGMDAGLASVLIERVEAWLGERQKFGEGVPVSLGASELGALLTPNQAVAVEIIESACNHAARAPDLPIPIRTVIGQFRVPLLRLALRSETLLAEPRHPALRMLDLIADLGRSMAPDSSLELPVCQALLRLAQSLGKALRITDKDLLSVLGSVESLLESRQRAALERAAACIDAAHRLERREVALLQASQTVQGMTAEPVDAVAREFIEGYWVHVLAKVAYRYGPGGHKWAARLQVAKRLLECTRPNPDAATRQQLMTQLPALLAGLEEGLRYIGLGESHVREGLAPCKALLTALIAGQPQPAPACRPLMGPSLAPLADTPHLRVLKHKQHFAGELTLPAEWADVDVGSRVALGLPDGSVMRGFVALIGPAQQLVLIADGDSPAVLAVTARALAQQAMLPVTRVFRDTSLVDEAATDRLINP